MTMNLTMHLALTKNRENISTPPKKNSKATYSILLGAAEKRIKTPT